MQDQGGILVLLPDDTSMFLRTRGEMTANWAYIGAGTLRGRDSIRDIQPTLSYTSDIRRDSTGLWGMARLQGCRCLAYTSDTPWTSDSGRHINWGVWLLTCSRVGSGRYCKVSFVNFSE